MKGLEIFFFGPMPISFHDGIQDFKLPFIDIYLHVYVVIDHLSLSTFFLYIIKCSE